MFSNFNLFLIFLILIFILFLFYKKEGFMNQLNHFSPNDFNPLNKKCAFCIPIYSNHFNYGYRILKELNEPMDADIYFIFTDENEKNTFTEFNKESLPFKFLILSNFINPNIVKKYNCFPSFKKFYALYELHKKYKYLSCIDCEITFIRKNNFYQMMESISNNKTICGGDIRNDETSSATYKKIITDTLTRLVPNDVVSLKKLSQNYNIYTWWSNLPVYDTSIVPYYLSWIGFDNSTFVHKMTWYVFDDLLYNYYLLLKYNYRLHVVPNLQHSLEYANSAIIQNVDKNVSKLYWVNKSAYDTNKHYYHANNFYIIYHLDR